jgi:hypothetical protein
LPKKGCLAKFLHVEGLNYNTRICLETLRVATQRTSVSS